MEKRHKDILRVLVGRLRAILVGKETDQGFLAGSLDRELERIGIAPDGKIASLDTLRDTRNGELYAYRVAADQLAPLAEERRPAARLEIIERAAYTWINRLLALRAMEVRNLIEDTLRAQEDYDGLSEQLYLLRLDHPELASGEDRGWWAVLNGACEKLSSALPGLFTLDDPAAALHPSADALVQCIDLVGGRKPILSGVSLAELDAAFADPDAIGWSYQFYQEEAKAAIDLKCKNGGKAVSRSELAAKTQLFTEPYMVQWLLQNSLGRSYHEAYPSSQLPEQWPYYIKPELRPDNAPPERIFPLDELTLFDPCMGSGHFLREAFDMFVKMYREQQPRWGIEEIVGLVLSLHIFGIDIDPRAAQLSALTLYLRAWELAREEQDVPYKIGYSVYVPPRMNLATTPTNLNKGMLQRHLEQNPDDSELEELLTEIFDGLEQADTLGSLLRSRDSIDRAIEDLLKPQTLPMSYDSTGVSIRHLIIEMAKVDPKGFRQKLFDRIANSFRSEASSRDDVSMSLFGYEAERGVRLLQVLDRQYAVVVTNPPYLGSSYMEDALKRYTSDFYESGRRDLYAAFILRCLDLCSFSGRVAMVTMQSWMFLHSFAELRAVSDNNFVNKKNKKFRGLLREIAIEALAHLGSNAFEEINGEIVQSTMFILLNHKPGIYHEMLGIRLVGFKDVKQKKEILISSVNHFDSKNVSLLNQNIFLTIPDSPLVYYLNDEILLLLTQSRKLKEVAEVRQGLATADDNRFLRFTWEVISVSERWATFTKGGGYCKWFGQNWYHVDWEYSGSRAKAFGKGRYQGINYYFCSGWSYSLISSGNLGVRRIDIVGCIGHKGPGIYTKEQSLIAIAQSHIFTFLLRSSSPQLSFEINSLMQAPIVRSPSELLSYLLELVECVKGLFISNTLTERNYAYVDSEAIQHSVSSILHSLEGFIEEKSVEVYSFSPETISVIMEETGTPAGWYPFVAGYDVFPILPNKINELEFPQEFLDYLIQHERIKFDNTEFALVKANLRILYEAGPGMKSIDAVYNEESLKVDIKEEDVSLTYFPIPTESFLEELSVQMKLHPISVYWLLEELRAEGVRCKPEELRLLEDRLTVIVLRLLGHRWPKQIEAGECVPDWADADGIIPLVSGTGERTLADHIRGRLAAEDGAISAQQTERLLVELTSQHLEQWLRTSFFTRHISQFKHRPIAWHLASTPVRGSNAADKGKKKKNVASTQRTPVFECFVYYHACGGDVLPRIRTQYVEPLLQMERMKINNNQGIDADDTVALVARERINELEAFVEKLREIEDHGFASPDLEKVLATETLDRWCADGYQPSASSNEFLQHEQAWQVDINDGVRVNIAPLQLAGVLTKDVLNKKDATKALSDRVHWRADERRWVREGKLPRCGWMDEIVPASLAWETLASQREVEQEKLAQKRLFAQDVEQEEVNL